MPKSKRVEEEEDDSSEVDDGERPQDNSDDDSSEDEEEEGMNLDVQLAGEDEDVTIEFDDPQEKHCYCMQTMLRRGALSTSLGIAAVDALASVAANDPESVGTVAVAPSSGEDVSLFGFAAIVRLAHYEAGASGPASAVRAADASSRALGTPASTRRRRRWEAAASGRAPRS
ncbi:hypothetical protein M885DRAFT_528053 [Pelagophyceae sp. CCMP2097]|nr:hypothetical protein M885DRAFT_528053 [Pelagophyceae sp. CCMP2097]